MMQRTILQPTTPQGNVHPHISTNAQTCDDAHKPNKTSFASLDVRGSNLREDFRVAQNLYYSASILPVSLLLDFLFKPQSI